MLKLVCGLVPHHPEHADAFFAYLARFSARKPITRLCLGLIDKIPYAYVRGEAWLSLSGQLQSKHPLGAPTRAGLVKRAISIAKKHRPENFTEDAWRMPLPYCRRGCRRKEVYPVSQLPALTPSGLCLRGPARHGVRR